MTIELPGKTSEDHLHHNKPEPCELVYCYLYIFKPSLQKQQLEMQTVTTFEQTTELGIGKMSASTLFAPQIKIDLLPIGATYIQILFSCPLNIY